MPYRSVLYAAAVLSFLGAVHWGLAVTKLSRRSRHGGSSAPAMTWSRLGWSVVPPLAAWVAVCMNAVPGLITFILAFAALYFSDGQPSAPATLPAGTCPFAGS